MRGVNSLSLRLGNQRARGSSFGCCAFVASAAAEAGAPRPAQGSRRLSVSGKCEDARELALALATFSPAWNASAEEASFAGGSAWIDAECTDCGLTSADFPISSAKCAQLELYVC